ncbi:hypothetical protein HU200_025409 [Digitaria exilis]|uniref:Beta-glucosidase n=1 Tax=Digitaria exilis TaxID=1010633 RepID=A0A835EV08_9POAL|nr:hypothetical protein HU200_025409 [Digitaria exilis]
MGTAGRCGLRLRLLLLVVVVGVSLLQVCNAQGEGGLTRGSFPEGFVFGTASSAYQYEGAVKEDGRGKTIWDTFAHTFGKVTDFSNADIAVDHYHRFEEDIQLMADMGMDAYRFSIAWSRILPNGIGQVNQAGIDHYNKLINALLAKGIEPYVTLYHWDLPQVLEDRFADPFFFGDYPASMRSRVGDRLPKFTADEAALVKGALDFVGINHYTTYYTKHNSTNIIGRLLHNTLADTGTISLPFRNGKAIGDRANSIWLYIVPSGMRSLMNYVKERYNSPPIYITENGMDDGNGPFTSIKDALKDSKRIKYHNDYLTNLAASIKEDGCDVRGYFAWSLLDNWEWTAGYSSRFGLYFVDYKDNLKRYPKTSVQWFKNLLSSS